MRTILIFDKEDAYKTKFPTSGGAILKGWKCRDGLYHIPLYPNVTKENVTEKKWKTMISIKSPEELLSNRSPPQNAINNVYKLKMQKEMVRYYHAAVEFLTKATWTNAIRNNQYTSWPELTVAAVQKHFFELHPIDKQEPRPTTRRGGCASESPNSACRKTQEAQRHHGQSL